MQILIIVTTAFVSSFKYITHKNAYSSTNTKYLNEFNYFSLYLRNRISSAITNLEFALKHTKPVNRILACHLSKDIKPYHIKELPRKLRTLLNEIV